MKTVDVACVAGVANELGECPIWDGEFRILRWVDIKRPTLHSFDPQTGQLTARPLPEPIASFALTKERILLVAGQNGFGWLDPDSGVLTPIVDPEADKPLNRFNDGRCDRQGRFWSGTMCDPKREPLGALYRFDADLSYRLFKRDIIVPNSLSWSPDNRIMYFSDTPRRLIWAFAYDIDSGDITGERLFADTSDSNSRPDGAAIDEAGCLWSADYGGGRVIRYTPDGKIDREISFPASNLTCCAFGGRDLDTLYVTSARQRMRPDALAREPLAGGLFAVRPGIKGLPESRFAGVPT